jgi:hypothetical protein
MRSCDHFVQLGSFGRDKIIEIKGQPEIRYLRRLPASANNICRRPIALRQDAFYQDAACLIFLARGSHPFPNLVLHFGCRPIAFEHFDVQMVASEFDPVRFIHDLLDIDAFAAF